MFGACNLMATVGGYSLFEFYGKGRELGRFPPQPDFASPLSLCIWVASDFMY